GGAVPCAEGGDGEDLGEVIAGHADEWGAVCALFGLQLLAREQKSPPPAALELEPQERQMTPSATHCLLGIAHLDDEQPARPQMSRRLREDDAHRVEPGGTSRECEARPVAVLRRQPPHP